MADGYISQIKTPDNKVYLLKDSEKTDEKVKQTANTEDKEFPIILKNTNNTTNETNGVKYDGEVTVNPNKSRITATTIQANSRLVASKAISQIITGTGTAGSYTNSTYYPAKWTFNTGLTATDGDIFTIKIPIAGHDYGVFMSIDNGSHYYPVVLNGTGRITTHYPVNTYLTVIFEPTGSAASVYAVAGQTSSTRITVTGGVWRVLNYYDSNSNDTGYYHRRIYPNLKAGGAIHPYSIIMQLPNGKWSGITTTAPNNPGKNNVSPVATGKAANTSGFMLGHVLLMYANTTYADTNNIGTYNIWSAHTGLIDARYSFNLANSTGNGFVAYTPVYIVGTVSDGLFHLDTTKWWAQTLPSSDDGKIYIYIGDAYDWYRLTFTEDKPMYWYKDGALRLYTEGRSIKNITRSGTTFTATRDDGSTFTFTQQDTNKYHKTGSWSGLTYTATAVNSADELKFTIPNKIQTNWELNATSGNSPALLFTRDSSLTDWKVFVTSGKLSFQSATDGSTWTERAYFKDNSGDFVATSFTGKGSDLTNLNASNISSGTLSMDRIAAGAIANGKLANSKVTIAGNDVSLGGSLAASTLVSSLGLSKAMRFIGVATVAITDGSTTDPVISGYSTKTAGDVIIDKDSSREYVWSTAGKWELLGGDESYWVSSTDTAAKFWRGDNTWSDTISGGTLKITNNTITLEIGAQNSSWTHFTSNAAFYFNHQLNVVDGFKVYNTNTSLTNNNLTFAQGGGWSMSDSTWIRTVGSKSVYMNAGTFRNDGTTQLRTLQHVNANIAVDGSWTTGTTGTANSGDDNATQGALGTSILTIGNATARPAAGTAGGANNAQGLLRLYSSGTAYGELTGYTTSARTHIHASTGISLPENIIDIMFRPGSGSYYTHIAYETSGNEALVAATQNAVTSFIFVNGESYANVASDRWTKLTGASGAGNAPGLQIKQNCVSIGELIPSGTNATYKLKVAGTSYFTKPIISTLTPSSWIDGQRYVNGAFSIADYSNTGSYNPWMRATNTWASGAESAKVGRWFSFGTLGTSFYWMGSVNTRTENSYDNALRYDTSNGYLYASAFKGPADSAAKWTTARTLTIGNSGKSVDGSGNVSWSLADIGAAPAVTGGYLPLSGGTLTGALNTTNNTWNKIGDDAQLGDINKAGHIGIQGINSNTGIFFTTYNQTNKLTGGAITWDGTKFSITSTTAIDGTITNSTWTTLLKPIASTTTASASAWNIPSGSYQVWGERFSDTRLKYTPSGGSETTVTDTGDWTIWLTPSATSNAATLNMRIDGTYYGSFSGNLSGNASSVSRATFGDSSNGEHNANNIKSNGMWYYTSNGPATTLGATVADGALYSQAHSVNWAAQIAQDYRDGSLFVRGLNGGTWKNWYAIPKFTTTTGGLGSVTQPVYIDTNGELQVCTAYGSASVNYATSSGSCTGNAATATKFKDNAGNTTKVFYRGDNTWSNILKQTAASALGIDTNHKIGTAIKDLHFTVGSGSGTGINDGNAGGITIGTDTASYGGIYWQSSGSYGLRLHFATTGSFANGAYTRMLITHDGKVGIGTLTPDTLLTVNGNAKADKFIGALQGNADTASALKDTGNNTSITAQYSGAGASATDWFTEWNGYKLVAVSSTDVANKIRDKASGNWSINISGTAATSTYLKCSDTRNATLNPTDLDAATGVRFDFKAKATISLTATDPYAGVMSFRPYAKNTDWSGGPAHQIAFNSEGLHWRSGGASWDTWSQILDSSNTAAGANATASLNWGGTYTLAKINGTDIKITMPGNPNTDHYAWSDITSKPETATRWPTWNEVTSKPSTFAPSAHEHKRLQIIGRLNTTANMPYNPLATQGAGQLSWCIYDQTSRNVDANEAPSFDAGVINFPWDWGGYNGQIAISNTQKDNTRMQIRSASHIDNGESANPRYTPNYGAWREVVTATKATKVGDTNKPVYINATGQATAISYTIEKSVPSNAVFTDHYAWGDITSKPDTATRWPKWNEIAAGADALSEGTSNWTDNTEILTSYASNNGFADSASKGVVYRRDAICAYNYIKGKLDSVYIAKSGGTMTGRLNAQKGFSNLLTGTGTAGVNNSGTYTPVKWTFNAGVTVADGDRFTVKIPNITNADWGVFMSVNNGTNYYPVGLNGTGRLTTHYPVNTYIDLVFEASGQVNSVFPLAGGTARVNVTGGCWRVLNYYVDGNPGDWNLRQYNIIAAVAITGGNIIAATDGGYRHLKDNVAFDIRYPILYAGSNIGAGAAGSNNYLHHYAIGIRTTQPNATFTAYKPLFIEGTLSGNTFTPISATPLTQTIPTSDNGHVYYYIGRMYNATDLTFDTTARAIFWYKNGVFQPYGGAASYAVTAATASSVAWTNVSSRPTKITLTGAVTGSVSLGAGDLSLATTVNHTHNYAGSSTAGGAATNAVTTANTADSIYLVGVKSGATTTLLHDTSITMKGGAISATTYTVNSHVTLQYNTTDSSLDFIFT